MTKRTIKKLRNGINNHNRRVRQANTDFEKMTPAEKRVRIARDVIEHVAAKKIVAKGGTWLSQKNNHSPLYAGDDLDDGSQLNELLPKIEQCNACAVGALLYCTVMRADRLTVGQIRSVGSSAGDEPGLFIRDFSMIKQYLTKFFPENQLVMMEAAFEQRGDTDEQTKSVVNAGHMFMKWTHHEDWGWSWEEDESVDEETRLVVIMKNVVDNTGTFKPRKYAGG